MYLRETPEQAGYKFISHLKGSKEYVFLNKHTNIKEVFTISPHHAGWALRYGKLELEFVRSEPIIKSLR